jgi:hypothetical protein
MKWKFGCLLFYWSYCSFSFAQEQDSVTTEPVSKYDYLIINGKFSDRFLFAGRDFGMKVPIFSSDMVYLFHSGWYLNASAVQIIDPYLPSQYAISVGYIKDISEKVELNFAYSQFFVAGESELAGVQNLGFFQAGIGYDWNIMYSTFQFQGLIHQYPDLFITSKHSRYFEFDQRLFRQIIVSFEPSLSFMVGTSQFYHLAVNEQYWEKNNWDRIRALNMEFAVPLHFESRNWGLELQAKYVRPLNLAEFDESGQRIVLGGSISYTIPVKKGK